MVGTGKSCNSIRILNFGQGTLIFWSHSSNDIIRILHIKNKRLCYPINVKFDPLRNSNPEIVFKTAIPCFIANEISIREMKTNAHKR